MASLFNYCSEQCQLQHYYHGHKGQCELLTKGGSSAQIATAATNGVTVNTPAGPKQLYTLYDPARIPKLMSVKPKIMTVDGKGAGLKNVGNTCFVNSVLQSLVYTDPLQVFLRTADHEPENCVLSQERKFCMICAMKALQTSLLDTNQVTVIPRDILLNLAKIGDQFMLGAQEDAHEFNSRILFKMHDAFLSQANEVMKAIKDPAERQFVEETTVVYQLFGGRMLSHVRCTECGKVSKTLESFLDLNLDLSSLAASVEEALTNFCKIEVLPKSDGYRCSKCERAVAAQKQLTIADPPNVLCIHLKRFDILKGGIKINKSVAFREQIDLKDIGIMSVDTLETQPLSTNYKYELYAMISHYGDTMWSGHYVAFVKVGSEWYLFDDDRVYQVNSSIVLKQNAYLLYYKKVTAAATKTLNANSQIGGGRTPKARLGASGDALNKSTEVAKAPIYLNLLTPTYKVYFKEEENVIKFVSITAELPLDEDPSLISLEVKASGFLKIQSPHYFLRKLDIPFPLDHEKAHMSYYLAEKLLVVKVGVQLDPSLAESAAQSSPMLIVSPGIVVEGTAKEAGEFIDEDSTMDLEAVLDKENEARVSLHDQKFNEGLKKVEHINVETNTYRALHKDIEELQKQRKMAAEVQKSSPTPAAAAKKAPKLGPNSTCPCGSGKKYKKCHQGKAL